MNQIDIVQINESIVPKNSITDADKMQMSRYRFWYWDNATLYTCESCDWPV